MVLKPVPEGLWEAVLNKAADWRTLELDFWTVGLEELGKCMEKCSKAERLRFNLDAPFKALVRIPLHFSGIRTGDP